VLAVKRATVARGGAATRPAAQRATDDLDCRRHPRRRHCALGELPGGGAGDAQHPGADPQRHDRTVCIAAVSTVQCGQAQDILEAVGETLWLQDEAMLDAVTAISGSGPAYVFYFIEALQQAARELGFNAEEARRLGLATFLGASKLAACNDEDVSVLRARVTSKNGTTERALLSLEANNVRQHII